MVAGLTPVEGDVIIPGVFLRNMSLQFSHINTLRACMNAS